MDVWVNEIIDVVSLVAGTRRRKSWNHLLLVWVRLGLIQHMCRFNHYVLCLLSSGAYMSVYTRWGEAEELYRASLATHQHAYGHVMKHIT